MTFAALPFGRGNALSMDMVGVQHTRSQIAKRFPMFSGKFNPLLDSYLFRTALTVAGFAAWMAVTYFLLSV